jgi:hypothetical protein
MNTDLLFENARLQGRVITLEAEVKCLEAVVRAHQRLDCLQVKDLNAEVERLTERNKYLEQIDSYLQDGINIANEKRCIELEAEVERLTKAGDWMMADLFSYQQLDGLKSVKNWTVAKGGKQP